MSHKLIYILLVVLIAPITLAHNVSESNAAFIEALNGPAIIPFMYLGAKHMVTGYDHLLYLVGVIFFLTSTRDVVLFVTLFTMGHSITLLSGVLGGIMVNTWLIDAIIGLSIVYKAFENQGGFQKLTFMPSPKVAVLIFGLCHGLGLATKLQDFALSEDGLVTNIVSFNVGVEIGQVLALSVLLLLLYQWRRSQHFQQHAFFANGLLMTAGFTLAGYHLTGFWIG
ncbi:MAG: HupE/UreJ family protein [Chloroflexota bacterium]